jgi:predicted NBD/HSP70 family sugar kinase
MRPPLTSKSVFAIARCGDQIGLRVIEIVGQRISLAVGSVASVLDPELVILGGGIGRNDDLLFEPPTVSSAHSLPSGLGSTCPRSAGTRELLLQ